MRVAQLLTLTPEQRTTLTRWSRGRSTPARLVLRAKIVLRAAEQDILVTPGSPFYHEKVRLRHVEILFEFGSIPTEEIEKVIMKLYKAWFRE